MTERLRGTSLVAALLVAIGLLAAGVVVALGLWGVWDTNQRSSSYWLLLAAIVVTSSTAIGAARGCFVEIGPSEIRDVIAWVTVTRVERDHITGVRIAPGPWRRYIVDLDDGTARPLAGASPRQFLARLGHDAADQDRVDTDRMLRSDGADDRRGDQEDH